MNTDKARERMLKLLALARRGEGGERDNAQRFLDHMLQKHGLTLDDLEDQEQPSSWQKFSYGTSMDRRLLEQVLFKVLKVDSFKFRQGRMSFEVCVTKAQHIEVELYYQAYRAELQSVLEHTYVAFVQRNEIFSDLGCDDDKPSRFTEEDLEQIMALMSAMPRTQVHRQIGHTGSSS